MRRIAKTALVVALCGLAGGVPVAGAQSPAVALPEIEGPVASDAVGSGSRDYPFGAAVGDLAGRGYVEEEFFFAGSTPVGPYKTRMLVRRPVDASRFSGTVVVEWQNVTNKFDLDALWSRSADHLMREGDAYVAVDAQPAGVVSPKTGLRDWSPARYGSLTMPAEDLPDDLGTVSDLGSFEIFGQGMKALRDPGAVDPLAGLRPKTLIATGTSQSALLLYLYAKSSDAQHGLVDGYLIAEATTSTLDQDGQASVALPTAVTRPVLWINSESDYAYRRQPDSDLFRMWEVAGTTHVDRDARDVMEVFHKRDFGTEWKSPTGCEDPPYSRIPFKYAQNASLEALEDWVGSGVPPRSQPTFTYDANGLIVRDANENALGGVRLPQFDVPVATDSRENGACTILYGRHAPFPPDQLRKLYPTHDAYVAAMTAATARAVEAGVLLEPDAAATLAAARVAPVPEPVTAPRTCRSRRVVVMRFARRVGGRTVRRVTVAVAGGKAQRVRSRTLRLSLAGRPKGTVRVTVRYVLEDGGVRTVVRRFRTCTPKAPAV